MIDTAQILAKKRLYGIINCINELETLKKKVFENYIYCLPCEVDRTCLEPFTISFDSVNSITCNTGIVEDNTVPSCGIVITEFA